MKRICILLLSCFLCLLFTACGSQTSRLQSENRQLISSMEEYKNSNQELKKELETKNHDLEQSEARLQDSQSQILKLKEDISKLSKKSDGYFSELQKKDQRVRELERLLTEARNEIAVLQTDNADYKKRLSKPETIPENVKPYSDVLNEPVRDNAEGGLLYTLHQPLNEAYSPEQCIDLADIIVDCLLSFKKMTGLVKDKLTAKQLEEIGNTDDALQLIGFNNIHISLSGIILEQNYLIKYFALKSDISEYRLGSKGITELEISEEALINARRLLQDHVDTRQYGD